MGRQDQHSQNREWHEPKDAGHSLIGVTLDDQADLWGGCEMELGFEGGGKIFIDKGSPHSTSHVLLMSFILLLVVLWLHISSMATPRILKNHVGMKFKKIF